MVKGLTYAVALLILTASGGHLLAFPLIPDPQVTVGDLCDTANSDFKEYRYKERIPYCNRNVSSGLKSRIYAAYGIPKKCRKEYTIDHFIPLSIGGSNEANNLWPEHKNLKAIRQSLETDLYYDIRGGRITQEEAIERVIHEKMNPPSVEQSNCH